ncbi:Gp19/Gp15/Gp42 family protein [Mycolicibacterium houstonense]|uniref:Gp19/Gp15/Gp42 family protein n=1 Tax=Mycolicibacterium houstonense TaxID=146021 RepID=UPI00082F5E7B|nr:Gp19/Gp15/Gp42 family protein [Mycolicibacterium houstonense]
MAHAQASDVAARLGRTLTADETTQVEALLDDAEQDLLERIPDLEDRIAADAAYLAKVIRVEASAVARLVRNPDGYIGETDGNYSYQLNWRLNTGAIQFTDQEWALLGLTSGVSAFDVRAKTPFERAGSEMPAYGTPEWVVWQQSSPLFWNDVL